MKEKEDPTLVVILNEIEPSHDKTNKMACAPSEDSDQPGHPPSLIRVFACAWRKLGSLATLWAHSEDSDQTWRMPRLIWVFAGRIVILLVLSWGGSLTKQPFHVFHKFHINCPRVFYHMTISNEGLLHSKEQILCNVWSLWYFFLTWRWITAMISSLTCLKANLKTNLSSDYEKRRMAMA